MKEPKILQNSSNNSLTNFLFSYKGRISRRYFWLGLIFPLGWILFVFLDFYNFYFNTDLLGFKATTFFQNFKNWLDTAPQINKFLAVTFTLYLFIYLPMNTTTKRLHDFNSSGWWQMIAYAPLLLEIVIIIMVFRLHILDLTDPTIKSLTIIRIILTVLAIPIGIYSFFKLAFKRGSQTDNRFGQALK